MSLMISKIKFLLCICEGEKSRVPFGIDGFDMELFARAKVQKIVQLANLLYLDYFLAEGAKFSQRSRSNV